MRNSRALESLAGAWRYERVVTSIAHGEALATSTGILQVDPTLDHHVHYRENGLLRLANGYSTASRAEYFLTYADNEVSLFFDRALTKLFQSLALCDWRPGEIVGMAAVLFRHSGPVEILGWFVSRRSIETTFQESRAHLNGILIKIGAKVVSHGRYAAFPDGEVAIPRILFDDILRLIAELRPPPAAVST